MRNRQLAGLVLAALAIVSLTGCQQASSSSVGAGAAVQSASETLAAAVTRTSNIDLRLTARVGLDGASGVYSAEAGAAGLLYNGDSNIAIITTADTTYVKGAIEPSESFARMETSRMAAACNFSAAADALAGLSMLSALTAADQVTPVDFRGTLDLTRVTGSAATMKTVEFFSAATRDPRAIDFTATLDREGYLVAFIAVFPGADGDLIYDLRLSDFGVPTSVKIPTSGVIEAPEHMYR